MMSTSFLFRPRAFRNSNTFSRANHNLIHAVIEGKKSTPEQAVKQIRSGDRVFIHSVAAAPQRLIQAMTARAPELRNVEIVHLHTEGAAPYADPKMRESFFSNNLFVGANTRKAVQEGRAGYIPVFLSEVPSLFKKNILPLDVALIQVSPPDKHGFCSLGVSVDVSITAVECAKYIIAQVNPNMPRTHGHGLIHVKCIDEWVEANDPIPQKPVGNPTATELEIGKHIAKLIEDGSTLQMGIGAIPDAVLTCLTNHKRLGIHTEMFSDGVVELLEKGVITNEEKVVHKNHTVSGFLMGSKRLYDYVDDNPDVMMMRIEEVNNPNIISMNPKVVAINSAIEVDLTGQVCADSIGGTVFSGIGGQMDFLRGASLSEGGKPIIAIPSTTKDGKTRIVPFLKRGAGVVTTRGHVHWVATEFGVVNLYGKNLLQRAEALISIAHPKHQNALTEALRKHYWQDWAKKDMWNEF